MPITEFKMPKMGESITEATIINWLKNVGDTVMAEETIVEVATDKVDNDVPAPVSGVITEIRFKKDDIVKVGEVLALIDSEGVESQVPTAPRPDAETSSASPKTQTEDHKIPNPEVKLKTNPDAFLSPLIISIAQKENLSLEEVQSIQGSGADGRIQKSDVFNYLKNRKYALPSRPTTDNRQPTTDFPKPKINFVEGKDRIVEMDRMRKMIADHMVYSKQTSPHVTSYIEVDVTNLVNWRNANKDAFAAKHNEKLTFTPIFVDAVAKAIVDFPMINVSVDGKNIIVHQDINIGMATALPSGNLIVPVVKNANEKKLPELAKTVNHLADSSRTGKLKPDEIQGSTFTISNVGTFGSLMGTPIINQPEVAILALGIIKKRPEVIETESGDEIAIRSMMFLSLSFDHRVVDGFLGGSFLRKVGDYLEQFDINTTL
ncbi:dihydrolipoamide acetyltransferase family protein [Flavobacterium caeni]|uniref:Dihydrolipoamide acetyltransferase component of pyruvate dehydrogenase complex n=1 Tax=Flavobacterium caeni TaxID=490189 RepID=A0A1G5J453_9FLAO|nr:dihydrolipoamide acetyltransferase family protein [Flavobacterium caeni]SCY83145.1 2-oxoglutarate dehydrogenase E2 component (dihydrolipoamide succinyltransferase) [Flavobacterium caeni]